MGVTCKAYRGNHRMKFSQILAASCLLVLVSSAPQRRRNQNVNTKFFTGNNAIDSAAWVAALGAGTQYFANQVFSILLANTMLLTNITFIFYFAYQVFNPCRGGNRGGTRGGNKGTNTRFFLGNNNPVGNGLVGFLGGFGTAAVTHSLLGNPCG